MIEVAKACSHERFFKTQQHPVDRTTEVDPNRTFAVCSDCGFETSEREGLKLMWASHEQECGIPGVWPGGICPELQPHIDAASTYLPTDY